MANDKILDEYQIDIPVALDRVEKEIQQLVPLEHQAKVLARRIVRRNELNDSIKESAEFILRQCELANRKGL